MKTSSNDPHGLYRKVRDLSARILRSDALNVTWENRCLTLAVSQHGPISRPPSGRLPPHFQRRLALSDQWHQHKQLNQCLLANSPCPSWPAPRPSRSRAVPTVSSARPPAAPPPLPAAPPQRPAVAPAAAGPTTRPGRSQVDHPVRSAACPRRASR